LPSRSAERRTRLKELAGLKSTLIFYEAPHRIKKTIVDLREVFGDRKCVVARELTKLHEEFVRGSLSELELPKRAERGEIVLLVEPPRDIRAKQPEGGATRSIGEEVEHLMSAEGLDQKSALKRVARSRGIGKSEAYRQMIEERERSK
jgi:16S rRNA (cytidine1402-2'-O)-methyltransferase